MLYLTNARPTVAIDVATGKQIWKHTLEWPPETPRVVCCGVSNKGAAIAEIYAHNCSACHGARMLDPQGAFDLRKFPREQRERFVTSVTKGKNAMPPWGDVLKPEEVEALWLYVVSGEPG